MHGPSADATASASTRPGARAEPQPAGEDRNPAGDPARAVPVRAGPDGRRGRSAPDHHRPRRQRALHLVDHDLPADQHDQRTDLRQAVRPLRPPAHPPVRRLAVPDRIGAVRPLPGDVAVHPVPRHPGPRRRRALPGLPRRCRGPLHARRARQVPRHLRRRVRAFEPDRPGHRRHHHRHPRLALGVLRQRAAGPRVAVHPLPAAALGSPSRGGPQHRLRRCGLVHGCDRAVPHRHHERPDHRPRGTRPISGPAA